MRQLREFAQHKAEFDQLRVRVVGVSVDGQEDAHKVWDKMTGQQFTILSDPGAQVIRSYGLLHEKVILEMTSRFAPRSLSMAKGGSGGVA